MVAPRWILIAILVCLSLGLCSSHRLLANRLDLVDARGNLTGSNMTESHYSMFKYGPAPKHELQDESDPVVSKTEDNDPPPKSPFPPPPPPLPVTPGGCNNCGIDDGT